LYVEEATTVFGMKVYFVLNSRKQLVCAWNTRARANTYIRSRVKATV
jgi:hypothetical protein